MVFSLTSKHPKPLAPQQQTSGADYRDDFDAWLKANPTWLEDKGFGGIQAQVITASTHFPDLDFSDPGKARGFDAWYENHAKKAPSASSSSAKASADLVPADVATGGPDLLPSKLSPVRCMPIYWEEKISEPVDLLDKEGNKIGHKITTTGAGYAITDVYNLDGARTRSEYQSAYGDWSVTEYEYNILSPSGEQQHRVTSSGQSGQYRWSSYEVSDTDNKLIESGYDNSDGYTSSTQQTYRKGADGSIQSIAVTSKGAGAGYSYESYVEYDANWNLTKSVYSDSHGYSSSTDRLPIVDASGVIQGYSVTSKGSGSGDYWYESTETLDAQGNLTANSYRDSYGYFSQRTSQEQEDPVWGQVRITRDVSGTGDGVGKANYISTAKYLAGWWAIESEHTDSKGYSSKLATAIRVNAAGEKTYVQTYWFQYADGTTSEWTTEYDAQWQPVTDGKVIDDSPLLWKTPVAAGSSVPDVIPVIEKTAVSDFQASIRSASDTVSEAAITGIKGQRDQLKGSDANDVFVLNDKTDSIAVGQKGSADAVMTEDFSLDLRPRKWDGIENAMLAGAGDLNLTGDNGVNLLSGNGGRNLIRGGAGADTLFGGGGKDIFVITKEAAADKIIDFASGEDKIALSGSTFRGLFDKTKRLKEGVLGDKLTLDADGSLWFDTDGSGPKAPVAIAVVGLSETIQQVDIIFIA